MSILSPSVLQRILSILFSWYQQSGGTALTYASRNGYTASVELLLAHGADPNIHGPVSIILIYPSVISFSIATGYVLGINRVDAQHWYVPVIMDIHSLSNFFLCMELMRTYRTVWVTPYYVISLCSFSGNIVYENTFDVSSQETWCSYLHVRGNIRPLPSFYLLGEQIPIYRIACVHFLDFPSLCNFSKSVFSLCPYYDNVDREETQR